LAAKKIKATKKTRGLIERISCWVILNDQAEEVTQDKFLLH